MSWKDKLRQVEPYVAGEQPKINNMIKLNTNKIHMVHVNK